MLDVLKASENISKHYSSALENIEREAAERREKNNKQRHTISFNVEPPHLSKLIE